MSLSSNSRSFKLPRAGLEAGIPAPNFSLLDLTGTQRTLAEFRGKRVLLVFAGPECGPCQELTPDLERLHQQHRTNNLEVVMISRGEPEANRTKAGKHGVTFPILLQRHWEVSKEYAMFFAPAGYLIDERGVIAKDVAIGADAILRLP
jgi:peroxiredoxin